MGYIIFDIFLHLMVFVLFFCLTEPIIREKLMSGKILIQWRHSLCAEIAKARYMDPEKTRAVHTEIANIFFNQDAEDSDETSTSEQSVKSGEIYYIVK